MCHMHLHILYVSHNEQWIVLYVDKSTHVFVYNLKILQNSKESEMLKKIPELILIFFYRRTHKCWKQWKRSTVILSSQQNQGWPVYLLDLVRRISSVLKSKNILKVIKVFKSKKIHAYLFYMLIHVLITYYRWGISDATDSEDLLLWGWI